MHVFLYETLPIMVAAIIAHVTYLKIDDQYDISSKISSLIPVKERYKHLITDVSYFTAIVILVFLNFTEVVHAILFGIIIGVFCALVSKRQKSIRKIG